MTITPDSESAPSAQGEGLPNGSNISSGVEAEKDPIKPEPGSTGTAPTPPLPPNGGLQAWLQVVGGFFVCAQYLGLANSFGMFQTYYTVTLLTSSSQFSISWIGSIQGFLLLFVGVSCGRAFGAGYFYPVTGLGILLSVFGMMMTSLGTEYYQIFFPAQGLCVGLGSGCLFTPGIWLVGTYFSTRPGLATAIPSPPPIFHVRYSLLRWQSHLPSDMPRALAKVGDQVVAETGSWQTVEGNIYFPPIHAANNHRSFLVIISTDLIRPGETKVGHKLVMVPNLVFRS